MRNVHKKQILKLLNTLREACKELEKQREQIFINLCADMQEFTANIFDYVGDTIGADSELSGLLKEFYEMLYGVTQGEVTVKQLQQIVYKMETVLTELKPDKTEVVFFCYKASMSDCLESIYFAAKEDPACDPYFIPIPYFDRNTDGSFGQMHLEGAGWYSNQYELTDWQGYNVEARRPDVAFIMNPYDDGNYVTSVHPDFYSERLKKLCGILCYVPYFVCRNDVDFVAKGNETMCVSGGVFYSDYVFVQSERVKQAYSNAIRKVESQMNRKVFHNLNDKLVALGSPKFDKVINTKREDCPLPDEWKRLIGNKKVVFYNTTVAVILQYSEECINKIRSVLLTFKGRTDVVLWWRPHPLVEQTILSMRPQLADQYHQIVKEYRSCGFGIYDDTPDLYRAITWSDAYYGDRSSLAWLYVATGKPILISAVRQRKRRESERKGWINADIEQNDLTNWLDENEDWETGRPFGEVFDYAFAKGDSGRRIYEYCKKAVKMT